MVAVVFYRAHELSGNTAFVDTLAPPWPNGGANPLPIFCGSLRGSGASRADCACSSRRTR